MPLRSLTALLLLAVTAAGCADAPVSTSTAGLVTLKLSVCASAPLTATFMSSIQATTEASSTFGGTIYGAAKEAELSCIAMQLSSASLAAP